MLLRLRRLYNLKKQILIDTCKRCQRSAVKLNSVAKSKNIYTHHALMKQKRDTNDTLKFANAVKKEED